LGIFSVIGRSRVASPPARMATGIWESERLMSEIPTPSKVERRRNAGFDGGFNGNKFFDVHHKNQMLNARLFSTITF
jgi:hypothetical protein